MMLSTPQQRAVIAIKLSKMGLGNDKEYKAALVRQFTNGKQTSTTKMYYGEAKELIEALDAMAGKTPEELSADRQRKKIIALAHSMEWYTPKGELDLERINNWCIKSGMYHKALDDHTLDELPGVVTQFKKVYQHHLKTVTK